MNIGTDSVGRDYGVCSIRIRQIIDLKGTLRGQKLNILSLREGMIIDNFTLKKHILLFNHLSI